VLGGGIRVSPSFVGPVSIRPTWLSRVVIYGEVLHVSKYYDDTPITVPRNDVRAGLSASVGRWYH
jgi:hypothetical protein